MEHDELGQGETKTTEQLLEELVSLRRRIAELEQTQSEHKKAGNKGRSLEIQLKDILDNAPVGVYRTTPDGRILLANPALVQMLGYSSFEELAQRNLEKEGFEPQYPRSMFKERIEKDGRVVGLESAWTRRDGNIAFIIETAWVVRDKHGRTLYYEGIVQDITELKKSKEALEESEQKFRSIFDNAADGMVLADIESKKFIIANNMFSQMLGCSLEEIKNLSVADIHPKNAVPYVIEQFERQSRKEINLARDIPVKRKDGSVFYADINAFPITLAGKAYIAGIFRDVTERKQAEDETKLLKRQLEFILGSTKTGLDIIDAEFNIRYVDPQWALLYGDYRGRKCYEYFAGVNSVCPTCGVPQALKTKKTFVAEQILPKENNRPIQVISVPFQDEKGELLLAEVNVDITERKRAEKSLRESEEMVRAILDATTESMLLLDKQGTILAINKIGAQRFGKNVEELVGFNLRDAAPDLASPAVIKSRNEHIDKVVRSGEPVRFEDERGGTIFDSNMFPVFDEKGEVVRLAVFARDITEQKKTEESLRELKHRYQTLFESAPIGIGVSTPDGRRVLECNDTMLRIMGYSEAEIKQINLRDIYQDPQRRQELLKRFERDGFVRDFEVQLKRKDGTLYYASLTITPFTFSGQNVRLTVQEDITERKLIDKKRNELLNQQNALIENMPAWVFLKDIEGRYIAANHDFDLLPKSTEDLIGKRDRDIFPKKLADVFEAENNQVLTKGLTIKNERRVRLRNGRVVDMVISLAPVLDDLSNITGLVGIAFDITERKKAEVKLKESEARFKCLFETARDGILVGDPEGRRHYMCNEAICKMLGYTEDELKRLSVKDLHHKKDLPYAIEQFERLAKQEIILVKDLPVKRKDGSVFYAEVVGTPIILGSKRYIMGSFRDITERKRMEDSLERSENKYRTLLENLPQEIFLKDRDSVYMSCNENYARDMKIKPEEIVGKTDYDFYPKELAEKYRADDKKIIQSGEIEDIEEKYIRDGKEVIVHTVKTPVTDEQGEVTGILGIFWDITEQKKVEKELDAHREKIARAEQLISLGTISASLTHELTQPLTVAHLSIESALAKPETRHIPGAVEKKLRDCLSGVSDACSIIKRFRDYTRGMARTVVTKISLKPVAERIVKLLEGNAIHANVSVLVKGIDRLPSIYVTERDIELLFFILIDNAIQAADGKKEHHLTISGAKKGRQIELRFADDCGGIAPENLDKIFEMFFTTKPIGKGTGLGLCIVKQIVSQTGGKVRVESEMGKGSTFFVTLPIKIGDKL